MEKTRPYYMIETKRGKQRVMGVTNCPPSQVQRMATLLGYQLMRNLPKALR